MVSVVLFRDDLRVFDNPALVQALEMGDVLPVFIWDGQGFGGRPIGSAKKWWLYHSLAALRRKIPGLVVRVGSPARVLRDLHGLCAFPHVFHGGFGADAAAARAELSATLAALGVQEHVVNNRLLFEPSDIKNGSGGAYKVFTPFWKACVARFNEVEEPLPCPPLRVVSGVPSGDLDSLGLLPAHPDWAAGWGDLWEPGEDGARKALEGFLRERLQGYAEGRDFPARGQTSRLSPHLAMGEISARTVLHAVRRVGGPDASKFLAELGWREFCHHLLADFPNLATRCWKPAFEAYPWAASEEAAPLLRAWQRGQTGYPLVDAGMRELWATGTMHNRVRMVVASFLVKHLRVDWREGEKWFWDTLVDADPASNPASWQWVAGCGADAAPYFRIFNPTGQAEKFDPDGDYIRRWCPELAALKGPALFAPFDASDFDLSLAGVRLGETYPFPIVNHAAARAAALEGYRVGVRG